MMYIDTMTLHMISYHFPHGPFFFTVVPLLWLHCFILLQPVVPSVRITHVRTVRLLPFSSQCCLQDISYYSVSPLAFSCPLDLLTEVDSIYNDSFQKELTLQPAKIFTGHSVSSGHPCFGLCPPKALYWLILSKGDEPFPTNRGSRALGHSWRSERQDLVVSQGNRANKLQGWS